MEEIQEIEEKQMIEIQEKGRCFIYHFDELEIDQVELAKVVGDFKAQQVENDSGNVADTLRSRGAEWIPMICSYIFKEKENGIIKEFEQGRAETDYIKYFKKLPARYREQLLEAIKDFFSSINESGIYSRITLDINARINQKSFLKMIANSQQGQQNAGTKNS